MASIKHNFLLGKKYLSNYFEFLTFTKHLIEKQNYFFENTGVSITILCIFSSLFIFKSNEKSLDAVNSIQKAQLTRNSEDEYKKLLKFFYVVR